MAHTIQNQVIINRPVDAVFAFVTDPTTTPQWQPNLIRSEIIANGPLQVGTQIVEVRRIGRWVRQAVWEVTEYESPTRRSYRYPHGFGAIRQHGTTIFTPVEEGTLVQFSATVEARGWLNLLLPFLVRAMQRQNERNFATLKRILETTPRPAQEVSSLPTRISSP